MYKVTYCHQLNITSCKTEQSNTRIEEKGGGNLWENEITSRGARNVFLSPRRDSSRSEVMATAVENCALMFCFRLSDVEGTFPNRCVHSFMLQVRENERDFSANGATSQIRRKVHFWELWMSACVLIRGDCSEMIYGLNVWMRVVNRQIQVESIIVVQILRIIRRVLLGVTAVAHIQRNTQSHLSIYISSLSLFCVWNKWRPPERYNLIKYLLWTAGNSATQLQNFQLDDLPWWDGYGRELIKCLQDLSKLTEMWQISLFSEYLNLLFQQRSQSHSLRETSCTYPSRLLQTSPSST